MTDPVLTALNGEWKLTIEHGMTGPSGPSGSSGIDPPPAWTPTIIDTGTLTPVDYGDGGVDGGYQLVGEWCHWWVSARFDGATKPPGGAEWWLMLPKPVAFPSPGAIQRVGTFTAGNNTFVTHTAATSGVVWGGDLATLLGVPVPEGSAALEVVSPKSPVGWIGGAGVPYDWTAEAFLNFSGSYQFIPD